MRQLEIQRRLRGLTQADLGERILYDGSNISRLESGALSIDRVSPRLRRDLEAFFKRPLEELLADVDASAMGSEDIE